MLQGCSTTAPLTHYDIATSYEDHARGKVWQLVGMDERRTHLQPSPSVIAFSALVARAIDVRREGERAVDRPRGNRTQNRAWMTRISSSLSARRVAIPCREHRHVAAIYIG